jgi:hypothetical protein
MTAAPTNTVIFAVSLIFVVLADVAWLVIRRQRSLVLKRRFGSEYDLAVTKFGSRSKAEAELSAREKRVAAMTIVPLAATDATRFSQAWNALQGRFVDNPKGVVAEADSLVRELMKRRGYPMAEFEQLAADISVDHPTVVTTYRAAQTIATRDARGEADTEELRKAVVYYRTLFDELLGVAPNEERTTPRAHNTIPVHS